MLKTFFALVAVVTVAGLNSVSAADSNLWPTKEFRGMWVATVSNIDWPSSRHDRTAKQKQDLEEIVEKCYSLHFNAIVFQVRTSGDAFYNSSLEPWSQYLTGTQGNAPSPFYDPLEFLIEKAHGRGIEVHAWFNPYRAHAGSASFSGLSQNHMANRFKQYAHPYGHNLWMDPGAKVVQDHIVSVFLDVVKRYDVDGIHMDDYFYPYPVSGQDFPDSNTFQAYTHSGGRLSRDDWRRSNVDNLVQRISAEIHNVKPYVKFGISPFGIWKPGYPGGIRGLNAYDELYADSRKWIQQGWLDYVAPQLYWEIAPPQQSYPALLKWWLQQNPNHHHIYTGNYASAIVVKHWNVDEIINQIKISRSLESQYSLGNIQFSMKQFTSNTKGISDRFSNELYKGPALTPKMPWLTAPSPGLPQNVKVTGNTVSWSNASFVTYWAVYKVEADVWNLIRVLPFEVQSIHNLGAGSYGIRSVNKKGTESSVVQFVIDGSSSVVIG